MYHEIGIQRLSPAQISKLLNGHKVRVKHGSGHEIHASAEQHKKIMSAHHKGKAHTIQFDPYQIAQHQHLRHGHRKSHGEGMYYGDSHLEQRPRTMRQIMGHGEGGWYGLENSMANISNPRHPRTIGHGQHAHHAHHPSHGDGSWYMDAATSAAKALAPAVVDYGANALKNRIAGHGEGIHRVHHRRHHSHGEGWLFDTAGAVARAVAPAVIDYGVNALKNKIAGHGIKRRGRPRKGGASQRGYGTHPVEDIYPAVMPHHYHASMGEGRRRAGRRGHGLEGGALNPAGYGPRRRGRPRGHGPKKTRTRSPSPVRTAVHRPHITAQFITRIPTQHEREQQEIEEAAHILSNLKHGKGVRRRGRPRGKGIIGSTLGSLAGNFLPF